MVELARQADDLAADAIIGAESRNLTIRRSDGGCSSWACNLPGRSGGRTVSIAAADVLSSAAIAAPSRLLFNAFMVFPLECPT